MNKRNVKLAAIKARAAMVETVGPQLEVRMWSDERTAQLTKDRLVSNGLTVSRTDSEEFSLAIHDGAKVATLSLTAKDLTHFLADLSKLLKPPRGHGKREAPRKGQRKKARA